MEFVLYYRGLLRSNGDARQKHQIRERFHLQLKKLWANPPLDRWYEFAADNTFREPGANVKDPHLAEYLRAVSFPSLIKTIESKQFLPLVHSKLKAVAELDITLLRPETHGSLITQGGDIDNRIKTLLDALKVPDANQARGVEIPDAPFHCLLEDDNLVTRLAVRTEHLLEPVQANEVILTINVKTRRLVELPFNHIVS